LSLDRTEFWIHSVRVIHRKQARGELKAAVIVERVAKIETELIHSALHGAMRRNRPTIVGSIEAGRELAQGLCSLRTPLALDG
jgi:hypothetical protein